MHRCLCCSGHIIDLISLAPSTLRSPARSRIRSPRERPRSTQQGGPLFEGATPASGAGPTALGLSLCKGGEARGCHGEPVLTTISAVGSSADHSKKFFHTSGNFRESPRGKPPKRAFHPSLPWIVLLPNVDSIIVHETSALSGGHLTPELDYELELAIVLKKSASSFPPEDSAATLAAT